MKVHYKKSSIAGLEDHETLFAEKVSKFSLRLSFYNWGSNVQKHFGVDDVEHIYEATGPEVSKIFWKLLLRKLKFDNSTTIGEIREWFNRASGSECRLVWASSYPIPQDTKINVQLSSDDGNHFLRKIGLSRFVLGYDNHKDLRMWSFERPDALKESKLFDSFREKTGRGKGAWEFSNWLEEKGITLEDHDWH